jgi:hypothetical protein
MRRWPAFAITALMLVGCSWPLKHSTYEVSKSIGRMYTNEVLWNLSQTISDANAVPSQLILSSGSVATSQSASASASIPLGDENQVVVNTGGTAGTTSTLLRPFTGLGAQLSGALTESWAVTPVTDPAALSRLRALYRYETSEDRREQVVRRQLLYDYVIPVVSVSVSTATQLKPDTGSCGKSRSTTTPTRADSSKAQTISTTDPACDTRTAGGQEWIADPLAGQLPNCVLCIVVVNRLKFELDPSANPSNLRVTHDTGCVREAQPNDGPDPGWRSLPSGGIPDHDQAILRLNCNLTRWLGWRGLSATNQYFPICENSVASDTIIPKTTSADVGTYQDTYRVLGVFGSNELYMCENAFDAGLLSAFVMHVAAASQVSASASANSGSSAGGGNANSATNAGNSSYPSTFLK